MYKFCLVWLLMAVLVSPALAIDLFIKDPVVSGLEVTVNASLSATSNYYLQGILRSQSSSKYFGETQNHKGDWIDYMSSPEKEYIVSNFFVTDVKNATWSGILKLRFKVDDPNYLGPGPYDLKLRRFTGGSTSSAGDSNTLTVTLSTPLITPTPSPSPAPSPSLATSPLPTPSPSPTPKPSPLPSPKSTLSPSPELSPEAVGTVAGATTEIDLSGFGASPSPTPQPRPAQVLTLNHDRLQTIILLGFGLLIISVAGFFGYRRYLRLKGSDLKG